MLLTASEKKTQANKKKEKKSKQTNDLTKKKDTMWEEKKEKKIKYPTLLQCVRKQKSLCAPSKVIQTFFFCNSAYKLSHLFVDGLFQPPFVWKQQESLPHFLLWFCPTLDISPRFLLGSSSFLKLVSFRVRRLTPSRSW